MSTPANIHDGFFKKLLSDRQAADLFLREHLPEDVVDLFAPQLPKVSPGSYELLGQHHSDLLFEIQLKTGQDALAYVLLEHKSSPDQTTRLQLLRYIVRILTRWHKEHECLPLPPVLPVV